MATLIVLFYAPVIIILLNLHQNYNKIGHYYVLDWYGIWFHKICYLRKNWISFEISPNYSVSAIILSMFCRQIYRYFGKYCQPWRPFCTFVHFCVTTCEVNSMWIHTGMKNILRITKIFYIRLTNISNINYRVLLLLLKIRGDVCVQSLKNPIDCILKWKHNEYENKISHIFTNITHDSKRSNKAFSWDWK